MPKINVPSINQLAKKNLNEPEVSNVKEDFYSAKEFDNKVVRPQAILINDSYSTNAT
jgi:hypothetical protein